MSGREWKPGDFAAVLCSDGGYRPAFYAYESAVSTHAHWRFGDGACRAVDISDARPLIVIDPENREQVERLSETYARQSGFDTRNRQRTDAIQAALRSLVTPPKPDEPTGLGAVVQDADGSLWVRWKTAERKPWRLHDVASGTYAFYADIAAVRVLSDGIAP